MTAKSRLLEITDFNCVPIFFERLVVIAALRRFVPVDGATIAMNEIVESYLSLLGNRHRL